MPSVDEKRLATGCMCARLFVCMSVCLFVLDVCLFVCVCV